MRYIENIDREWDREPFPDRLFSAVNLPNEDSTVKLRALLDLADIGSSLAMLYIGDIYSNGRGCARDVHVGQAWYEKSEAAGSIEAAHRLAFFAFHKSDYLRSIEILEKISETGFIPATYCLGSYYFVGTGVDKDERRAMSYWELAESEGHLLAKQRLSIILRSRRSCFGNQLKGIGKLIALIGPFVRYSMNNPRSDRLRSW